MARRPELSLETLRPLGADKLAQLLLDAAAQDAALRKRVKAALAALKGPDAVAAMIERRLGSLERARGRIDWDKEKTVAADLDATRDVIVNELGAADPGRAVEALARFLRGHAAVLDRADDNYGRLQRVYADAAEAVAALIDRTPPADREGCAAALTDALGRDLYGYCAQAALAAIPLMEAPARLRWEESLRAVASPNPGAVIEVRQALAQARGDLDLVIALEEKRPAFARQHLRVAQALLDAQRLDQALDWARRARPDVERTALEARILEAKGDRDAAQALRWAQFERSLDVETLRDYLRRLDDFLDDEALDRAFALADAHPKPGAALLFYLRWPRLDRAAGLVIARHGAWDGRDYRELTGAADALENDQPLAATVLRRALLDAILDRALSYAYPYGVMHLFTLNDIAPRIADWAGLEPHDVYVRRLRGAHGRKSGFWTLADGEGL